MADFLVIQDLIDAVGARSIIGYFDDENNGTIDDNTAGVDMVLSKAEGEMYARLLRHYPGDTSDPTSSLRVLVANDPALRSHVVSVALEYAAERRPAFLGADGSGPYQKQFDRAIDYFETLSKGQKRSPGERLAGKGANTGGKLQPKPPAASSSQFIFARSRNSPTGHGGFVIPLALACSEMLRAMVMLA